MANALYTFDDICRLACDLANNPGLYQTPPDDTEPRAYKLLKLWLHDMFLTYDWEFNLTLNQSWSVAANGYSVSTSGATNYRNMAQVIITTPSQAQTNPLQEMPLKDINNNIQQSISTTPFITGLPQYFHMLPDRSAFYIYPVAQVAYSGVYSYYTMPNVAAYVGTTVLPFEDSMALMDGLSELIQRWDKESRSELMRAIAVDRLGAYRNKQEDQGRSNARQWRWGPNYRKKPSN